MSESETPTTPVSGERAAAIVSHERSIQTRLGSVLAVSLMSVIGVGFLTWYYANAALRPIRARQSAQDAATHRAQGDLPLPGLGRIDPPAAPPTVPAIAPIIEPMSVAATAEPPVLLQSVPPASAPVKSAADLEMDRRLSGAAFEVQPEIRSNPGAAAATTSQDSSELSVLLRPSASESVRAQVLPTLRLLLPKGAFIDCTLETAIDSTLPGMTTCITATDTFGADGRVVLLERGTKLVGEVRGQVAQGSARVFVLWEEARTPTGVIVPLASPGTDELGRAGLTGQVDRHFWERFGAAMLISVVDGAVQWAAQSASGGNSTVIVNPSASQSVLTEVLKGTVNIPPTVTKHQGDRIQVLVARDLDFRTVYALQRDAAGR